MAKRRGKRKGGKKQSITPKQKAARRRNMAIARAARSKQAKVGSALRSTAESFGFGGSSKMFASVAQAGKSKSGKQMISTMGHGKRIGARLKRRGISYKRTGRMMITIQ